MLEDQIRAQISDWVAQPDYQAYFPVGIKVLPGARVEVYMDGDEGIDLGTCQRLSRHLETLLDEHPSLPESYTLEVSSPGASRPLSEPRQYPKHIGRTLYIKTEEGAELEGILRAVDGEGITIETQRVEKIKKKKHKIIEEHDLKFTQITSTQVKIII